jgi:hypothetical protein
LDSGFQFTFKRKVKHNDSSREPSLEPTGSGLTQPSSECRDNYTLPQSPATSSYSLDNEKHSSESESDSFPCIPSRAVSASTLSSSPASADQTLSLLHPSAAKRTYTEHAIDSPPVSPSKKRSKPMAISATRISAPSHRATGKSHVACYTFSSHQQERSTMFRVLFIERGYSPD